MIDFHTHILPEIDDGSSSVEESVALLRLLQENDVSEVVFTPHFYGSRTSVGRFLERREQAFEALKRTGALEDFTVHLAAEVQFTEQRLSDYAVLQPLCIDGGNVILLELPFSADWEEALFENLELLQSHLSCIPVVAHIERYPAVQRHPQYIARLCAEGCLLQVNCNTACSLKKYPLAELLFRFRQVCALGSDCHNVVVRPPHNRAGAEAIVAGYSSAELERIERSMQALLNGSRPQMPRPVEIRKTLFGYRV